MRNFMASWRFLICRWNGSVYANSTNISKYCVVFADVLVQYLSIQPIQLLRRQCCLGDSCERNMIFHITHEYMFPHLQEEGNLLDRCAGVHVFESRIISSACFHPDDDVHWGKANFAHTDTSQLSRDLRVSLQEHMFTFSKLSRPLEIKLSRHISYLSEKLYHAYEKSKTDVFQQPWRRQFTEWDSEEKFWSQVFGGT